MVIQRGFNIMKNNYLQMTSLSKILEDALLTAINGEMNAVKKYQRYARIANSEGFPNVGYLFKALVEAEKVHIKNHRNALGTDPKIEEEQINPRTTLENLQDAYNAEIHEHKHMYPDLRKKIKKTRKEQIGKVTDLSFEWAQEVELTHAEILRQAINDLNKGKDFQIESLYVCRVCGNLRLIETDEICPICGHDAKFYKLIERNEEN